MASGHDEARSSVKKRRKNVSREARFKKGKAVESAARSKQATGTPSSTTSKAKQKAREVHDDPHPFRYKSFNDRLASVHINVATSLGRRGTGALAGLDGHGIAPLSNVASSSRVSDEELMDVDRASDEDEVDDVDSAALHAKTSFGIALHAWRELNLSLPFTSVAQNIQPLSLSLPLLLHHQHTIAELLTKTLLDSHKDSYLAYEPVLDLIPRLAADLGSAFLTSYPTLVAATLQATMVNKLHCEGQEYTAATIVERAFESLAATFRCMAPFVLRETPQQVDEPQNVDWLVITWELIRPYLGWSEKDQEGEVSEQETNGDSAKKVRGQKEKALTGFKRKTVPQHTRRFSAEALAHLVRRAKPDQLRRISSVMMEDARHLLLDEHSAHFSNQEKTSFLVGLAGVWAEVAKSVEGRLHSNVTVYLSAVLLSADERRVDEAHRQAQTIIGTLILTSLSHHATAPELISVFEWLERLTFHSLDHDPRSLHQFVQWTSVVVGVRKGKRVDDRIKGRLFALLLRLSESMASAEDESARMSTLQLIALALPVARIQDLIGAAVKIMDALTPMPSDEQSAHLYATLTIALARMEFDGFQQVVLPSILKVTTKQLMDTEHASEKSHALKALCMLDQEHAFASLPTQTPTAAIKQWQTAVRYTCEQNIQSLASKVARGPLVLNEEEIACIRLAGTLHEHAHVSAMIECLCTLFTSLTRRSEQTIALRKDDCSSPSAKPTLASVTLASLTRLMAKGSTKLAADTAQALQRPDGLSSSLQDIVIHFSRHRSTVISLARFVTLAEQRGASIRLSDMASLLEALNDSVCSADEELRLSSVQLLSTAERYECGASEEERVFAKLAKIEEKGLKVETVRERIVLTRSIARSIVQHTISTKEESRPAWYKRTVELVIRSLVSTMKLNLRPLWKEVRLALADLSTQYASDVWSIAFSELTSSTGPIDVTQTVVSSKSTPKVQDMPDRISALLFQHSIDKSFQDPVLIERKQIVSQTYLETSSLRTELLDAVMQQQQDPSRLDVTNYHIQILTLFSMIAPIVERHNAPLMQHFFQTIVNRHSVDQELAGEEAQDEDDEPDDSENAAQDEEGAEEEEEEEDEEGDDVDKGNETLPCDNRHHAPTLTRNQRREQLCAYLDTFSQFSNPKALAQSEKLHRYLLKLCSQGDNKVQKLALDVILCWKDPAHVANAKMMKTLLTTNQFREQLTSVVLAEGAAESTIQSGHRASLMPLLLRLLFGIITSKQSRASGQANRTSSILSALADLKVSELQEFVDVMLEPFDDVRETYDKSQGTFTFSAVAPSAARRLQVGFIGLLGDVLKYLGVRLVSIWTPLVCTTLNITHFASLAAREGQGRASQADRSLRQNGLHRLNEFFRQPTASFSWQPFMRPIFHHLLTPRFAMLRVESVQASSAVLDIIHTWSSRRHLIFFLVEFDDSLLSHVIACLATPGVKFAVVNRILDILENIVELGSPDTSASTMEDVSEQVQELIIRPNTNVIMQGVQSILRLDQKESAIKHAGNHFGQDHSYVNRSLHILAQMVTHVSAKSDVDMLVVLLGPLLRRGNSVISEKNKVDILIVFDHLMPKWLLSSPDESASKILYDSLSALFSRLRSRVGRQALCQTFARFNVVQSDSFAQIVTWIDDLNAFDSKRMQEVDFDRRLNAFDAINATDEGAKSGRRSIPASHWPPLLHNFVYYIQDAEELAIRSSAGTAIRRFVDLISSLASSSTSDANDEQALLQMFSSVIFPGLRRGLRSPSDLVKREVVETMGHCVARLHGHIAFLSEMRPLLVEGDEEANFFNNVHHVQVHRRARALSRLGVEAQRGTMKSRTITDVFLPIVEHFLRLDVNHGDGNLIQHSVECLGHLSSQLSWGPFNVLLWRYLSLTREKDEENVKVTDKVSVRAALAILDNFTFSMDEEVHVEAEAEAEAEPDDDDEDAVKRKEGHISQSRQVLDAVRHRLLPKLMACLDLKDELDDGVRLPIAIGIAKMLLRMPFSSRRTDIVRLLNTLAHVFRSKSQETRDLARSTLAKVAVTLGPTYFVAMLSELRKVLTRGPQVAVLAFTVHNVLLQCMDAAVVDNRLTVLEEGVEIVMDVVVEDIFGRTAEDRQSIEHRTTYKEVKATKSADTLEQVAKIVDPQKIRALLTPLQRLMHQTEAVQAVRSFDECLRRIATGLQSNSHLDSETYLVLCFSLLSAKSPMVNTTSNSSKRSKSEQKTVKVLSRRQDLESATSPRDHFAQNAHRFVAFGLDLLASAMRKAKFDFAKADVLAKLEPLVDAVGNTLYAHHSTIVSNGLRCLALLIKCPLQSARSALTTIVKQTMKLIAREGNTRSDILIASIKLLTVVLRDVEGKQEMELLTEGQISLLCRLIDSHIEEDIEMQGTLFGLLRAIISRKRAVTELYDLMDKVARMMIVQQTESARAMARASFLDFLLEMPQGQRRLDNQIHFLVKNFDYVFESGRRSVMEFVKVFLQKVSVNVVRPYTDVLFVGLVMRLANDDSAQCRHSAAELIEQIVRMSQVQERAKLLSLTNSWSQSSLEASSGRTLARVAAMVYVIFVDAKAFDEAEQEWPETALMQAEKILETCVERLEELELKEDDESDLAQGTGSTSMDWQLAYHYLQVVIRLFKRRQDIWSETDSERRFLPFWPIVSRLLLFPHSWVRLASSRLLGEHFGTQSHSGPTETDDRANMVELCKRFALALRSPQIDQALSTQIVKNLVFLGKCFATVETAAHQRAELTHEGKEEENDEDEEDNERDELWQSQPLRWLFNKLSHQLRRSATERAYLSQGAAIASSAILKWMAAMMSQLEEDVGQRYLIYVVAPLFRILEVHVQSSITGTGTGTDVAGKERREAMIELAGEVQEVIQAKVGSQSYAQIYAQVKRKASDKRRKRKAQEIQRGIEFPEQMLARKAQKNQRKHESRKRKSTAFAQAKGRVRR